MADIILLHGALGAADQLSPLKEQLEKDHTCHVMNFYGHGGETDPDNEFSIQGFARQLERFVNDRKLVKPHIFGFSMGGYVALYLASYRPDLSGKVITLGTKLQWDPETAAKETKMLNPDKIEEKVPHFAEALKKRHYPEDWKAVTLKTAGMLTKMGDEPPITKSGFQGIPNEVHLMLGDMDDMVSRAETEETHKLLQNSQFRVMEDTPHPLEKVDAQKLKSEIDKALHTSGDA